MNDDTATDKELAELFGMENIEELYEANAGMMGRFIHQVCDGAWIKSTGDAVWRFIPEGSSNAKP